MLHKETVTRGTLELLIKLMSDKELKDFSLVGGTAMALYIGHRVSIDLDLFSWSSFNSSALEKYLSDQYGFKGDFIEKNTLNGTIDGIKIDCITHDYPQVEPLFNSKDGIRMYSIKDIAAMKLSAIADNGTRLKDFIDIACLSTRLTLAEMVSAYQKKYVNANPIRPIRGLTYFEDVVFNEPIQMINGSYKWDKIEQRLRDMVQAENRLFHNFPIQHERKHGKGLSFLF